MLSARHCSIYWSNKINPACRLHIVVYLDNYIISWGNNMDNINYLNQHDLRQIFRFGRDKMRRFLASGILPVVRIGNNYYITQAQLDDWMRKNAGKKLNFWLQTMMRKCYNDHNHTVVWYMALSHHRKRGQSWANQQPQITQQKDMMERARSTSAKMDAGNTGYHSEKSMENMPIRASTQPLNAS